MKKLEALLLTVVLICVAGCSPRINSPDPLTDLSSVDEDYIEDLSYDGPSDFTETNSDDLDDWSGFTGEEELTSRPNAGEWQKDPSLETVYFAYDSYDLDSNARHALVANAENLRNNHNLAVLIEGHCDERGTEQYNQALGENRAFAVREYLIQLGVSSSRLQIISYGELRPLRFGSDGQSFRENRRAEFKVAN